MLKKIEKEIERSMQDTRVGAIKYYLENEITEEKAKAKIRNFSNWEYIESVIYCDDEKADWWFDLATSTRKQYKNKLTKNIDEKVKEILRLYF